MPRVSAAHEQHVRDRIVRAAIGVFSDKGYHRATMQDVVRASGLSVGAIYTYFAGKDELFLASCTLSMERGFGELGDRLARGGTTADKLAIAIGFFIDSIDPGDPDEPGEATYLVQAWAEAGQSPTVRETLVRRREKIGAIGQILLREGIARGELPAWLDVEAVALGYSALLDGLVLQRIEDGDVVAARGRRATGVRRARAARSARPARRSDRRVIQASARAVQLRPGPRRPTDDTRVVDRCPGYGAGASLSVMSPISRRRQGATPSSSISSEKLRNVRTRMMIPRTAALSIVASIVTVRTMSARIRISRPSRIVRPIPERRRWTAFAPSARTEVAKMTPAPAAPTTSTRTPTSSNAWTTRCMNSR